MRSLEQTCPQGQKAEWEVGGELVFNRDRVSFGEDEKVLVVLVVMLVWGSGQGKTSKVGPPGERSLLMARMGLVGRGVPRQRREPRFCTEGRWFTEAEAPRAT